MQWGMYGSMIHKCFEPMIMAHLILFARVLGGKGGQGVVVVVETAGAQRS